MIGISINPESETESKELCGMLPTTPRRRPLRDRCALVQAARDRAQRDLLPRTRRDIFRRVLPERPALQRLGANGSYADAGWPSFRSGVLRMPHIPYSESAGMWVNLRTAFELSTALNGGLLDEKSLII